MKFASTICIKKHLKTDHGIESSEKSDTEHEVGDERAKKLIIMTRSMSQQLDLKKYRGKSKMLYLKISKYLNYVTN
jgi:hypothetical protein